jgi:beta-glucosidase
MPTDNGQPRSDGVTRSAHLTEHIYWMKQAIADGLNVIGYNYWSITDNYEWGTYEPRFGLYTVNVLDDPSLTRTATDAVATYQQIISDGIG